MIFTIFRDFFWIFPDFYEFYFRFKMFKIIKKITKSFYISRGATWMRRGTQGHVAAPRGPAQCLRGALYLYYLFITYIHKMGLQPSLDGKGY